jgi:hypothetical protein
MLAKNIPKMKTHGQEFAASGHQCVLLFKSLEFLFLNYKKLKQIWEYVYMVRMLMRSFGRKRVMFWAIKNKKK